MASKIAVVYRWRNPAVTTQKGSVNPATDIVVVYNEKGEQMSEYRMDHGNFSEELKKKILKDADEKTRFFHGTPGKKTEEVKKEEF